MLDFNFRWQYYFMSETGAVHKKANLCELLDQFVDAQRLDVKAYCSGHLNESKLYHSPNKAFNLLWLRHNQSPVSVPGGSATSQNKIKRNDFNDGWTKQHYNLKPLKSKKLLECIRTVYCTEIPSQILSTRDSQEAGFRVPLNDHISVDQQHVPSCINSEEKTAFTAIMQQPLCGIHLPRIDPQHSKAGTKKDQFKKMRDYHNNVIQCPTYVRRHAVTGYDAVKYLEHHLNKV